MYEIELNVMYGWLNMHAGRGNFAIHSAANDLNAILGAGAAHFGTVSILKPMIIDASLTLPMLGTKHGRGAHDLEGWFAEILAGTCR